MQVSKIKKKSKKAQGGGKQGEGNQGLGSREVEGRLKTWVEKQVEAQVEVQVEVQGERLAEVG